MSLVAKILDIIYPKHYKCIVCGREIVSDGVDLCDECRNSIDTIPNKHCDKCGGYVMADETICHQCKDIVPVFVKNYPVFVYDGDIKSLLFRLKYNGRKYIASTLSRLMYEKYLTLNIECDVVIPVPLHPNRLKSRGYNQSELLLSCFKDVTIDRESLVRIRDTAHQTHLGKRERLKNLDHAFKVESKKNIKGKRVLLVDDVYTTGTTVNECSKVLLNAGATSVIVMTLCRKITREDV